MRLSAFVPYLKRVFWHFDGQVQNLLLTPKYLFRKFGNSVAVEILRELSCELLRDYCYYGIPLHDWFYKDVLETAADSLLQKDLYGPHAFAHDVIMTATEVQIQGKQLLIQKDAQLLTQCIADNAYRESLAGIVFRADTWPDEYKHYDAVRDYAGFVPSHTFSMLQNGSLVSYVSETDDRILHRIMKQTNRVKSVEYRCPGALAFRYFDPVYMEGLKWENVIASLRENADTSIVHKYSETIPFLEVGKKRYVLYAYINPRPLTEEDKAFVSEYDHIPKYRECVEKGWSILFYNYQDGYVIAPGIVDRNEMLKLLPDEAKNHNDGLDYYFTDGTFAF